MAEDSFIVNLHERFVAVVSHGWQGKSTNGPKVQTQARGVGWVGWDNNIHVLAHTQARQPHHLSCSHADTGIPHTGTALSSSASRGVGSGETITFMSR